MVPSGPMVADAPLPIPSWPRLPTPVTGVDGTGCEPRFCPKSKAHLIEPCVTEPGGGETAYRLPVTAVTYTVPSGATAGATLTVWPKGAWPLVPTCAVQRTRPLLESIADSTPGTFTMYSVPSGPMLGLFWTEPGPSSAVHTSSACVPLAGARTAYSAPF